MGLTTYVGNASSFLYGIQDKMFSYNGSCAEVSGPQSAKPGHFSSGEPASFFTGVVAGTKDNRKRRWHSVGGKDEVAQVVSGTDVSDSASGSSGKTELVTAQSGAEPMVPSGEIDLDGALSGVPSGEIDLDGPLSEASCSEADSNGKQIMVLGQPAQSALGTARGSARSSGAGDLVRTLRQREDVLGSGGAPPLGRRAMRRIRQARGERAEAGSDNFDVVSSFMRCESHVASTSQCVRIFCDMPSACRTARNSHNSLARDTGVHDAMQRVIRLGRNARNSSNSWGDTEGGRLHFCVLGTKSPSMSIGSGVRCSAVDEHAHTQQASLKLHEETWAGHLQKPGLKISQEVEIVPGCAVRVACPSCPDYSPEPLGPGRVIRHMLGWVVDSRGFGLGGCSDPNQGLGVSGPGLRGRVGFYLGSSLSGFLPCW